MKNRDRLGTAVPRRKYGRMQKPIPPVPREKCRLCRLKKPCPIHARSERP